MTNITPTPTLATCDSRSKKPSYSFILISVLVLLLNPLEIAFANEQELETAEDDNASLDSYGSPKKATEPVSSWIGTFGRDPEYGLRRNRRITERAFEKLLTVKFIRLVTKPFGKSYLIPHIIISSYGMGRTQSA